MKRLKFVSTQTPHPITSTFGNTLPLFDPLGRLIPDAPRIIHAFMFFPDDPITAWTWVTVMDLHTQENEVLDSTESERSVVSWLHSCVTRSLKQTQIAVMVGSALLAGSSEKKTISQRKAHFIVQKKIDASPNLMGKKMPRDERNIRDAFNRFKPSIHLHLAMLTLSASEWQNVDRDEAILRKFLAAAAMIQGVLAARNAIHDWRPWVIHPMFADPDSILEIDGLSKAAMRYAEEYKANPDRA
jgi:hypothetical protein